MHTARTTDKQLHRMKHNRQVIWKTTESVPHLLL